VTDLSREANLSRISLRTAVSQAYLCRTWLFDKFYSERRWSIALVVTRREACVREARSFYIAFRLQDDLNPSIDNQWYRSWASLLRERYLQAIQGYRRPWSSKPNLGNSREIYLSVDVSLPFLNDLIKNSLFRSLCPPGNWIYYIQHDIHDIQYIYDADILFLSWEKYTSEIIYAQDYKINDIWEYHASLLFSFESRFANAIYNA